MIKVKQDKSTNEYYFDIDELLANTCLTKEQVVYYKMEMKDGAIQIIFYGKDKRQLDLK